MNRDEAQQRLVEEMFNDPEARRYIEDWARKTYPKASVPMAELRAERDAILAEVAKHKDEMAQLVNSDKQRRAWESSVQDAKARHGISDDDIPAVEKIMTDEGVASHTAAAELYRARTRVAPARSGLSFTMDVPGVKGAGGEEYKGLVEDPDAWARRKAVEVLEGFQRVR